MFAIVSLVVAGLLAAIMVLIIRSRRVSAPTAETPQIVYFENKRDSFLDWLYHRTSSPEVPVQVKLRDWVDLGFYAEGGNYWGVAQQFTYYLVQGGYVYAYDTEGNPLDAGRVLRDRPDAFQLTPSEYQRRVTQFRQ
mgnify:FL=1